jgi:deoxyribose-phosphate aldolase
MTDLATLITQAKQAPVTEDLKKLAIHCLDYTSLNDTDTTDDIRTLCQHSATPLGNVAAVCVYPNFVNFAKLALANMDIKIATVVNFPSGNEGLSDTLALVRSALFAGADEIDVVLPYQAYLNGQHEFCDNYLRAVKEACGHALLKVILETGELANAELIRQASLDAIAAGADFLKTSTGKVSVGATLEAAAIMLDVIQQHASQTGKMLGFKASGGIRTAQDAAQYLTLAQLILDTHNINSATFRIGASSLLKNLLGDLVNTNGY